MIAAGLFIAALAVAQDKDLKKKQNNPAQSTTRQAETKIPPTAPTSQSDADAKKHLAGVKYEDRQASSVQTLDGASKDAAKSDTTPAKTGESQSAANAQDSKKQ